jgi:pentapeptide MXKDX repeat protein
MKVKTFILATAMFAAATSFAVAQTQANDKSETKHDATVTNGSMSKDTMAKDSKDKANLKKDQMNGKNSDVSPASPDAGIKQVK